MNKTAKKLYNNSWEKIAHEIVEIRDGKECVLKGIQIEGEYCDTSRGYDLDHCFSRNIKFLFFDTSHLQFLCKKHHQRKSFAKGGAVDHAVREKVRLRVGPEKWKQLLLGMWKTCPEWATVYHQEHCNVRLKEELAMMMAEKE